jgi:enoyl-CoA hydratase/carnithine racemase
VAKELVMTGRRVSAPEAVRLGLANHEVPQGEELVASIRIAEELMALPSDGVAAVKRGFNELLIERARREDGVRPTPRPQRVR